MLTQSAEGTMCNDYRLMVDVASIIEEFEHLKIKIRFPEGRPNIEAREDIRITDTAPIVRTAAGERGVGELVQRRWCWPSPTKKPVYNFRSEDREFNSNRVLVIADAFFEFTTPEDPKKKRKNKWMFRKAGEPIFAIAASGVRRRRLAKPSPC
ncbi:hypothetical protein ShzoTeo12_55000 (plasmid) [Shinella zoogloeoides]|nr:hypothetical protein ShzoTeo12_55000 [Shinella zoogloeoides]